MLLLHQVLGGLPFPVLAAYSIFIFHALSRHNDLSKLLIATFWQVFQTTLLSPMINIGDLLKTNVMLAEILQF